MSTQFYINQAKRYWQTYPESAKWMQSLRLKAVESLENIGLPTTKNEKYKYTNFDKKLGEKFQVKSPSHEAISTLKVDFDHYTITIINGLVKFHDLPKEVQILELNEIDPKVIKEVLDSTKDLLKDDPMFKLNEALTHNGLLLRVSGALQYPIVIEHILSEEFKNSCKASHNIIVANEESQATILEIFTSNESSEAFNNLATTVITNENANIEHVTFNTQDDSNIFVSNLRSIVHANATYSNVNLNLGSKLARYNLHVVLKESGSHADVHGLYALKDDIHCDISSYINHKAPHTTSDQLYKGILDDKSRGVFTGLIKVDQEAQLTDAKQLNRNLLLSLGAQANSRPQLEIFADDVKCSHGSTTGQLSEDELFYFESRGIRKDKARQMLAKAFSYEVILKVRNLNIRNYLQRELTKNFGNISL